MPLDKKKIKEDLEKEKNTLTEQLKDIAKFDPATGEWETTPDSRTYQETDPNDMADRFEDYEARSSMMKVLKSKLEKVTQALKNIGKDSFGKCEVCKKDIELARMKANPSACTCKKHL